MRKLKTLWIVWFALALHLIYAITVALTDDANGVTAIHDALAFFGSSHLMVAGLLLACAGSAFALSKRSETLAMKNKGLFIILCLVPQQLILMLTAFGAVAAIVTAQFADGITRPRSFLLVDQAPVILTAIFHTIAVLHHALATKKDTHNQWI